MSSYDPLRAHSTRRGFASKPAVSGPISVGAIRSENEEWLGKEAKGSRESSHAARRQATAHRYVQALMAWLVLQVFFNDIGGLVTLKVGVNLRPDRLFLPVVFVAFIVHRGVTGFRPKLNSVEICLLALFGWAFVSMWIAGTIHHPRNRHLATLVNLTALPAIVYWQARRTVLSRDDIDTILRTLLLLGLYLSATAAAEHFRWDQLVFPKYIMDPGVGIHWGRARGPFGNAAVLGGVLSIAYVTTLYFSDIHNLRWRAWPFFAAVAVAVYFTYTRSSWLTLGVSLGLLVVVSPGAMRRHGVALAALALVVFVSGPLSKLSLQQGTLFTKRQGPVEDRENIMRASIAMIRDRPLLGFGYGTFETANDRYFDRAGRRSNGEGNHNALAGILVELGLLGGVPYVWTFASTFRRSWRLSRDPAADAEWRKFGAMSLAVLAGYCVGVQFFDPRFFALLNCLVFLLFGVAAGVVERLPAATTRSLGASQPRRRGLRT